MGQMFARECGHPVRLAAALDQAHRQEQRQHDVGRSRVNSQRLAQDRQAARLRLEPREQVELHDGGGQQIGGIETVAVSVK